MIEVLNARTILARDLALAGEFAQKHNLPQTAGSDAHLGHEIGVAYVEMPTFENIHDFKQALTKGKIGGHRSTLLVHVATTWGKLASIFRPHQQ